MHASGRRVRARESVERDRVALRAAFRDLKTAARTQVAAGPRMGEHPYAWLFGTFAVGLWLGARRAGGREEEP